MLVEKFIELIESHQTDQLFDILDAEASDTDLATQYTELQNLAIYLIKNSQKYPWFIKCLIKVIEKQAGFFPSVIKKLAGEEVDIDRIDQCVSTLFQEAFISDLQKTFLIHSSFTSAF